MIGKLWAIFTSTGLGCKWDDRFGIGNPVSHQCIKQYFKSVKEVPRLSTNSCSVMPKRLRLGLALKKAIPIFFNKLEQLAVYILAKLGDCLEI